MPTQSHSPWLLPSFLEADWWAGRERESDISGTGVGVRTGDATALT